MLKGAAKASSTPPWSIAPPCSFALIAAPPGSQEVGSVPSQPSLAKLPGDQWNIPCCKLSVFVSVFCSVKSPSHTCSNPPFPTRKGNAVIQTEPPSLSEVFLSGRSDHTSSGMQCCWSADEWEPGIASSWKLCSSFKDESVFLTCELRVNNLFSHHYSLQSNF